MAILNFNLTRWFRLFMGLALLCAFAVTTAWARDPVPGNPGIVPVPTKIEIDALAMLFQVGDQLSGYVTNKDLDAIHNEDVTLGVAVNELLARADANVPHAAAFKTNLVTFSQRVGDLHLWGDLKNQKKSEVALTNVLVALDEVKSGFPAEAAADARKRADTFTCAMHQDIVGTRTNFCPKCGTPLDQVVRILSFNSVTAVAPPPVRATVRTTTPLTVGQPATVFLQLEKTTGEPVAPADLVESHTKKLHLLIVDKSLTDYHHEHPQPTKVPGEYTFTFSPQRPGPYRMWADIRPYPLGLQQYATADIPATTEGAPFTEREVILKAAVDGLNYELILATNHIRVGRSTAAKLRVTHPDGSGVAQLEPFMAAFAHLVGFSEDYETVLHMHPKGMPVLDLNARGGPELEFQIYALKPGFVRLFAQVQLDGKSHFAPFGIQVEPATAAPTNVQRRLIPFSLTEQSGRTVTHENFLGKIVALNIMFTGCSDSSGEVVKRMEDLQRRTADMPDVLLVSLTVDPKTDTPAVLSEFAKSHNADTNRWLFLTGDKADIRKLVETSFFPRTEEEQRAFPTAFNGIDSISILDRRGRVEQSFDGLDPGVVDEVVPAIQKLNRRYGR